MIWFGFGCLFGWISLLLVVRMVIFGWWIIGMFVWFMVVVRVRCWYLSLRGGVSSILFLVKLSFVGCMNVL